MREGRIKFRSLNSEILFGLRDKIAYSITRSFQFPRNRKLKAARYYQKNRTRAAFNFRLRGN